MRRFSELYEALDATTSTNAKVEAMAAYFRAAPAEDAAWAVFFLTGQRLKRLISGRMLREWALRYTGLPEWLVGDAHAAVGDSAETVTLLVARGRAAEEDASAAAPLARGAHPAAARAAGRAAVRRGDRLVAAAARARAVRAQQAADRRLSGRRLAASWWCGRSARSRRAARDDRPSPDGQMAADRTWYHGLLAAERADDDPSRPYPFFLASPLEQAPQQLGRIDAGSPNGSGTASAPS